MIQEPTQEQVKEFWKWCGFKLERIPHDTPFYVLNKPDGEQYNIWIGSYRGDKLEVEELYPSIDLNNLFRWAVPSLKDTCEEWWSVMVEWAKDITGNYQKDTLALFWALWQVKEDESNVSDYL